MAEPLSLVVDPSVQLSSVRLPIFSMSIKFVWLPGLMWAVVLWQSFLGWWRWVRAGSGSGFATEDEIGQRSFVEKLRECFGKEKPEKRKKRKR